MENLIKEQEQQEQQAELILSQEEIKAIITPLFQSVDPKTYGLSNEKAVAMLLELAPIIAERNKLEEEYKAIIDLELTKENCKKFAELKGKVVKNRTRGIEAWHKKEKRFYLDGGRYVDNVKNKESEVNSKWEEELEKKAKHFENLEKERIKNLVTARHEQLKPYVEDPSIYPCDVMEDVAFDNLVKTLKAGHEARIKEEERIKKEELEKEAKEKLRTERRNELLPYWHILDEKTREVDFSLYPAEQWSIIMDKVKAKDKAIKEKEAERQRLEQQRATRLAELNKYLAYVDDVSAIIELDEEQYNNRISEYEAKLLEQKAIEQKRTERKQELVKYNEFIEDIDVVLEMNDTDYQNQKEIYEGKLFLQKERLRILEQRSLEIRPYIYLLQDIYAYKDMSDEEFETYLEQVKAKHEQELVIQKQNQLRDMRLLAVNPYKAFMNTEELELDMGTIESSEYDQLFQNLMARKAEKDLAEKPVQRTLPNFDSFPSVKTHNLTMESDNNISLGDYKLKLQFLTEQASELSNVDVVGGLDLSPIRQSLSKFVEEIKTLTNEI